jgi:nudix-type nucleoside diphosphatase (YffH/AdpP family)
MATEIVGIETAYQGWGRYLIASLRLANGQTIKRAIEDHGAAVAVLPYDAKRGTAILVRQLRAPVLYTVKTEHTLEVIAGILDDPATAARREAMEETGVRLGDIEQIATVWTMPGISTERMTLFLARYSEADRVGQGGGLAAEQEETVPVEISLHELAAMADSGRLDDMKTFALVQTLRMRRPELFVGA